MVSINAPVGGKVGSALSPRYSRPPWAFNVYKDSFSVASNGQICGGPGGVYAQPAAGDQQPPKFWLMDSSAHELQQIRGSFQFPPRLLMFLR